MFNKFILTVLFLVSPLILVMGQAKPAYVGTDVCGACHKSDKQGSQLSIWKDSKHAKAFETLKTKEADEIAKKAGFTTPAAETEACLKCHVSGNNVAAELKQAKFKVEDGVQCETCHGAGSEYKSLKIMKDRKEAIAHGLVYHEKKEDYCVGCHNQESPTFKGFEFSAMWDKIKHPVPAGEKK